MTKRIRSCLASVALLLAVTACSAGTAVSVAPESRVAESRAQTATATPTYTSSPTPMPTVDVELVRMRYLAEVEPWRQAICDANQRYTAAGGDLQATKEAFADLAVAARTWADHLRAIDFPPDAQDNADNLIENTAAFGAALIAFHGSPDWADGNIKLDRAFDINAEGSELANVLRGELGLPDVSSEPC